MHLPRAEGFLYTKHPMQRPGQQPMVTRGPINDDGEMFGYAYTARRLPRPTLAALAQVPKAWGLKLVFGYAYTARYERIDDGRVHDDRIEPLAA
jgi:hypothetical protein